MLHDLGKKNRHHPRGDLMLTRTSQAAFDDHAQMIRPSLHREAFRLCGDWHEADDLVQVTLWRIYRRWDSLTEHERLSAYCRRALLRTYLQEHRRSRWRFEASWAQPPDSRQGDLLVDDSIVLQAAVNQLAAQQRAVITLRFMLDLSVQQTAVMLGCTSGTVTSQTHRALAKLRRELSCRAGAAAGTRTPEPHARGGRQTNGRPSGPDPGRN